LNGGPSKKYLQSTGKEEPKKEQSSEKVSEAKKSEDVEMDKTEG